MGGVVNPEEQLKGLSDVEAAARIARYGFNEHPASKPRSIFRIAFEVVREPMFLLLLACGGTYLLLGDVQEAIILLAFVWSSSRSRCIRSARRNARWKRCGICRAPARW